MENKYAQNWTRKQQNGRHDGILAAILELYRRVIEIFLNWKCWIKSFCAIQLLKSKLFIIIGYILFARQI